MSNKILLSWHEINWSWQKILWKCHKNRQICVAMCGLFAQQSETVTSYFHVVGKKDFAAFLWKVSWGFPDILWEQQQIQCELFIRNYTWLDDGWMFLCLNRINGIRI